MQKFAGICDQVGQLATSKYLKGKVEAPYNDHDVAVEETSSIYLIKRLVLFLITFTFDNIKIRVIFRARPKSGNLIKLNCYQPERSLSL